MNNDGPLLRNRIRHAVPTCVNEVAGHCPAPRLNAEPGAALAPTATHDGPPTFGFHTCAKAVCAFAFNFARLICTFHLNVLWYPGKAGTLLLWAQVCQHEFSIVMGILW